MKQKILILQQNAGKIFLELSILISGSIFLALFSQLAIPLPFTPVPLTLQTLAVFLLGGILGGKRASWCVIIYLTQGCCGLPVFAGGVANPLWILDPKAGFLISFVPAAYLIGILLKTRLGGHLFYNLLVLSLGQMIIFFIGWFWLIWFVGIYKAFIFAVAPFLSGALIKIVSGALFLKSYQLCRNSFSKHP